MPRPGVGNPGNKGGGRKGALIEFRNAERLWNTWTGKQKRDEVLKLLQSGEYSLEELFNSLAFGKNEKMLLAMFNKIWPDKTDFTSGGKTIAQILNALEKENGSKTSK